MKNKIYLAIVITVFTNIANAQETTPTKNQSYIDLGIGIIKNNTLITTGYYHNWNLSKSKKVLKNIYVGTGLRFMGFTGKNAIFQSAPPSLYGTANADTLFAPTPFIYSISTFVNFGYNFTSKLQVGFDLDALGFSFGPTGTPSYIANGITVATKAKPTVLNALLVAANDIGTLNGGLYIRYKITEKIGVKLEYHSLFTELTTTTKVQVNPELNDRFRHGTNLIGVGVAYNL